MALFPMFVNLKEKDCLVIGAGEVALRKIEQLVKFSPLITVIAPVMHPEIRLLCQKHSLSLVERRYESSDLQGRFLVIGALDDIAEQEKIYDTCMEAKIPVNCVDSPALCSFIFPALIVEGDLCVGINTAGRAPAVSSALRQYLTRLIPSQIGALIDHVDAIRHSEPVGKPRQEKIIQICREFFKL
ncbi:MAG TPA: bifunctional precorrin-2 dehydrogenase/sirohydrochlorin ferrochelatase [Sulfuricurvum sp.]|nr:bifunctional precorrin-2 dehydrogenase/sirohydrochlorin ferrochelatase [Sulfuricurvum sp.]